MKVRHESETLRAYRRKNGNFDLSDVVVEEGDTISFVIGSNGSSDGDEVALSASIEFEVSSDSSDLAAEIESGAVDTDGTATLQFSGTAAQSYAVEWTSDLTNSNGWNVIDEIPYLSPSTYSVDVDATGEQGFLRVRLDE
jgi:hypothetical protein